MIFQPKVITRNTEETSDNSKERKRREKSHVLIPDYIIKEIIDNKKENGIVNTYLLNKCVVAIIKLHVNPSSVFSELTHLREYLIQWKKVRLFYISEYQVIIKFRGKNRIIEVYHNADLLVEGEIDITTQIP